MDRLVIAKRQVALLFESAAVHGMSISGVIHRVIHEVPQRTYTVHRYTINAVLQEWKELAGVPVISVYERVDRMSVEVREALTQYIVKLEASN